MRDNRRVFIFTKKKNWKETNFFISILSIQYHLSQRTTKKNLLKNMKFVEIQNDTK